MRILRALFLLVALFPVGSAMVEARAESPHGALAAEAAYDTEAVLAAIRAAYAAKGSEESLQALRVALGHKEPAAVAPIAPLYKEVKQEPALGASVVPLEEVAPLMADRLSRAALSEGVRGVVVRVERVGGNTVRSVRLSPDVWAKHRVWPAKACSDMLFPDQGACITEFGRLNGLTVGWQTKPLSRGDAYFPLPSMDDSEFARVVPSWKGGEVEQVTGLVVSLKAAPKKVEPAMVVQQAQPKQVPAPIQVPTPAPKPNVETRVAAKEAQPAHLSCWGLDGIAELQCIAARPSAPKAVASVVPSSVEKRAIATLKQLASPPSQEAKTSAVPTASSLGEVVAHLGKGRISEKEVISGLKGGCKDGSCSATYDGASVIFPPQVGDQILAKRKAYAASPQS